MFATQGLKGSNQPYKSTSVPAVE